MILFNAKSLSLAACLAAGLTVSLALLPPGNISTASAETSGNADSSGNAQSSGNPVGSASGAKIGKSGLPLPRYVSLAKPKVNLRKGPGLRYPIEWVYRRDRLPVEIIAEFDTWRQIRDWEGTVGWVHRNMLRGRRSVMIQGGTKLLRESPEKNAPALLQAEAGVIGQLVECDQGWCRVEIAGRSGWLERQDFFGVYPNENIQ